MAERNMLFTWDLQSFNENLNQSNDLLPLHHEFVTPTEISRFLGAC